MRHGDNKLGLLMLAALIAPGPLLGAPGSTETQRRPIVTPIDSLILGESGTVIVEATADGEGKATDVRVEQSSNHPRLDEAAVTYVSGMSIASGELPENMRGGGLAVQIPITFHKPRHAIPQERAVELIRMSCREALTELESSTRPIEGTAILATPPIADVVPLYLPDVASYAKLKNAPETDRERVLQEVFPGVTSYSTAVIGLEVAFEPIALLARSGMNKCREHADMRFVDALFPAPSSGSEDAGNAPKGSDG